MCRVIKIQILLWGLFVCAFSLNAQIISTQDSVMFFKIKEKSKNSHWDTLSIKDRIVAVGKEFLAIPYVAYTLENPAHENLVVNFHGLDCTTFLESIFTLAITLKDTNAGLDEYCMNLQKIRYRNGVLKDYTSRLHYFSDWIFDNQENGLVVDITKKIGGEPIRFSVGYMSSHPDKYSALQFHPEFVPVIAKQEKVINSRRYFYIPKEKLWKYESDIHSGDLIAITTNLPGLDISHVGFAVEINGELHFMHASSSVKKVLMTDESLVDYLLSIKHHTGVIVLRVL